MSYINSLTGESFSVDMT